MRRFTRLAGSGLAIWLGLGLPAVTFAASAEGTLIEFDSDSRTFTIANDEAELGFALAPNARVTREGKAIALEGLRPGDFVEVNYGLEEGQRTATLVEVRAEPESDQQSTDEADDGF